MCQAQIVQTKLEDRAGRPIILQAIKTRADTQSETPLVAMSGEGVFVKELEAALLDGRIDCAVHSLKDLPLATPRKLRLAAVLEREEPRDAVVSRSGEAFDELPSAAAIGTSSLRRRSQLLFRRRDVRMVEIRGNVDTRLRKLDDGRYDAVVVAACGLIRLGLEARITEYLDPAVMLPEPGQGALAVEARADDRETLELLAGLDDPMSRACVDAERAMLGALGGGCRVPIGALGSCTEGILELTGAVIAPDGHEKVSATMTGVMTEPVALGRRLAEELLSQGAEYLLKDLKR